MHVIESVLATAGITAVGRISPWSVSRIVKGYIAACIQLGYEMQVTKSLTLSFDEIVYKDLNYVFLMLLIKVHSQQKQICGLIL